MGKFEPNKTTGAPQRHTPSLFGPIVLIAIGLYFLANNLGVAPQLHWGAALRLWPLFLVFAGLNVITRQMSRPLGSLLSAFVALLAMGVFGVVLFFADQIPALARFSGSEGTFQTETISFPASEVNTAEIAINFDAPKATIFGLSDSSDLISGEVSYQGELIFEHAVQQGNAVINLETHTINDAWLDWLNPSNWSGDVSQWRIGLSPRVPTDLALDFASGSIEADLSRLNLTALTVDGSSGSAKLMLPNGDYTMDYDSSSGAVEITLPERGRATLNIEGSSGSVTLLLPDSMALRVVVDGSNGSFQPGNRLEQVGSEDDNEIWQTDDYASATNRLNMRLDMSSGSIRIGEP